MTRKTAAPAQRAEDKALEDALVTGALPDHDRRVADAEASVEAVLAEKNAQIAELQARIDATPTLADVPSAQPPFVLCDHAGIPVQ